MENRTAEFYDRFASKYDVMVSEKRYDEELPFFINVFKKHNVKSILDCSCGTGRHVVRFSRVGFEVTGSDVSIEMIRKAKRNARMVGIDVSLVQVDFKRLTDVFGRKFDSVVCWGNSLDHELQEKDILSALRSMYDVLRDEGVVIVQIRNLPKLVKEGIRIFPMHYHKESNGDRKLFIYVLDFHGATVRFNVASFLEFNGKPKFEVDSADYRVISAQKLVKLATEAGFGHSKVYGDPKFGRFNEKQSEDIIVVGTK